MEDRFTYRVPFFDNRGNFINFVYCDMLNGIGPYNAGICHIGDIELCAGLKDRNGKLIYEGDILKVVGKQTEEITGYVQWLDDFCKFSLNIANSKEGKYQSCEIFCDFDYLPETERKIIGNIYENKELLGVEE